MDGETWRATVHADAKESEMTQQLNNNNKQKISIHKDERGFPCGTASKESTCNVGDLGSISGLGKSPGEGKGYPLQYSGLENSMDCIVYGVTKSQT